MAEKSRQFLELGKSVYLPEGEVAPDAPVAPVAS